jgi:alcohol dehydrogenase class IV
MRTFDFQARTRLIFGEGAMYQVAVEGLNLGFCRTLFVSDRGLATSTHVAYAIEALRQVQIDVLPFHDFESNPDTRMVEAGTRFAASQNVDSIVALGGGSSMDCAKGINFLLTNGGRMADYRGYGNAKKSMLPMIAIPTTAGTGSEAQSYALISDAETHVKMACGDPKAAFRVALLDPALTVSQPHHITASAGFDAIAHAVETYVTTKRTPMSEIFSREAWQLLESNYERVLAQPDDLEARGAMQLGAYYAGVAIENSMLGATHACANPLTARYGTEHGAAIAMLLPSVVRWNERAAADRYATLLKLSSVVTDKHELTPTEALARRLEELATAGGLQTDLSGMVIQKTDLVDLAADAAEQWTGAFNPRPFDKEGALEVYSCAY